MQRTMNRDRTLIYSSVFAIMGLSNTVTPILPELAAKAPDSLGSFASSLLFSGYFLGALVTMLPFGVLADNFGNYRFIKLGILLTALAGVSILLFENIWVLSISRFVEGIACGAFFPAALSLLSKCKDQRRRMGEFTFLFNSGLAAGALFSGILAEKSLKGAILIFTVFTLFLLLPLQFRIRKLTGTGLSETKKHKQSFQALAKNASNGIYRLFEKRFSRIWFLTFLLNGATGILIALYPDYSENFLTKAKLGSSIASLYACAMFTSYLIGRIAIGENIMIRLGILLSAIGAFLAIHHPFLGFPLLGGGGGIAIVGLILSVVRMDANRGMAMGLFNTCIYAGFALAPIAAGVFTGVLSFEEIFLANACILVGAAMIKE